LSPIAEKEKEFFGLNEKRTFLYQIEGASYAHRRRKSIMTQSAVERALAQSASVDKLDGVRNLAKTARDLQLEIDNYAERIVELREQLQQITNIDLPELMHEANISQLKLTADGNKPAVNLKLKPFYRAGIAASWAEERKQKAYDWLVEHGHGDLIKATVTVKFNKEDYAEAQELSSRLTETYDSVNLDRSVHAGTLSAWLREQVEEVGEMPPLEVIGGSVGQVVTIEKEKRKKSDGKIE
jgi:hypothetical protein